MTVLAFRALLSILAKPHLPPVNGVASAGRTIIVYTIAVNNNALSFVLM